MNDTAATTSTIVPRYVEPGWFTTQIANRMMRRLTRIGVSIRGSRELAVRGRSTGEWRTTPVNPMTWGDARFLVAPRGETQWVRNLRVAGSGELRLGRRVETFTAVEVADHDKVDVLREYLRRWKAEVGVFFGGIGADADDATIRAIAGDHPVFRINA